MITLTSDRQTLDWLLATKPAATAVKLSYDLPA